MSTISMEYPSSCQTFGNQYYEKTEQRKQPPKLQHHQTESAKVRNRVWFCTGPNSKSTNQERPQNISILCKHIIPHRQRLLNLEHLVVLLAGPISHTSTRCMDFVEIFNIILDLSITCFSHFSGC